jgi:hypothetical protein
MTEPKFTPGPWFPHVSYMEGFCVDVDKPATVEDMRLIRAAPDLYKTLEWAYTTAVEHDDQDEFDWAIYCERLYQALAKARGESHD